MDDIFANYEDLCSCEDDDSSFVQNHGSCEYCYFGII